MLHDRFDPRCAPMKTTERNTKLTIPRGIVDVHTHEARRQRRLSFPEVAVRSTRRERVDKKWATISAAWHRFDTRPCEGATGTELIQPREAIFRSAREGATNQPPNKCAVCVFPIHAREGVTA